MDNFIMKCQLPTLAIEPRDSSHGHTCILTFSFFFGLFIRIITVKWDFFGSNIVILLILIFEQYII